MWRIILKYGRTGAVCSGKTGTRWYIVRSRIACRMHASTLMETLVMMLVAGIVFLAVMDGLTLFTRLQARRMGTLLENGRRRDGYFRLESLAAGIDSIRTGSGGLDIFHGDRHSVLALCDSALVYRSGEFRDTLLTGVTGLRFSESDPDTLEVALAEGFTVRFPVQPPSGERYRRSLEEIEEGYDYEK